MTPRETYEAYLLSQHWHDLREAAFNRSNRKCEVCAAKARNGHHLIYRTPLESCTVEDIMSLCIRCHDLWHEWLDQMGWKVAAFCRQSTRGALLVLLNPLKSTPPVPKKKEPVSFAKQLAESLIPASAPKKSKIDRRKEREQKRASFSQNPEIKHAMTTMSRDGFKAFMRSKFGKEKKWASIMSTTIAIYDKLNPSKKKQWAQQEAFRKEKRAEAKAIQTEAVKNEESAKKVAKRHERLSPDIEPF